MQTARVWLALLAGGMTLGVSGVSHAGSEALVGKTVIAEFAIDRTVTKKFSDTGPETSRAKCSEHFSAYFSTNNRLFISYQSGGSDSACLDTFRTAEQAGLVIDLGKASGVTDGGTKLDHAVKLKYSVSVSNKDVKITWSRQNPVWTDNLYAKTVETDSSSHTATISFAGCKVQRAADIRRHDDIDNPSIGKFGLDVVMKSRYSLRSCKIQNGQPN